MNPSLRRFLRLMCCLLAASPLFVAHAEPDPSPATLSPGAVADLEWFGALGFPDVRGCPAARVATGQWSQSGSRPPVNRFIHAFLLRHDEGTGHFSVLTADLFTRDFETTKPGTPEHERVGYEEESLAATADAFLADLARPRNEDDGGLRRRFGERLSERTEVFTWAWACWRNGLDERAARFYEHAATMTSRTDAQYDKSKTPVPLREKLERDLGYAMIWRATLGFEDPKIPRTRLLEDFERVARDYPASKHAASARDTADRLRAMVAEDAAHAARPAVPLDDLPPDARVAELVFRLRDQNGHQFSQPGSCDIFDDFGGMSGQPVDKDKSPAHGLVAMGYGAVPRLIAALDDRTFSRSVGFHRDFYFSHHVLTVGDCALQTLQRIAGRSFYTAKSTSSYMSRDEETVEVKKEVESWWQEFQQKGEKGALIEAVVKGDRNAAQQAALLCERYPDDALEPLMQGARHAADPWTRGRLVTLAGEKTGDAPVPFLEEELRDGPLLGGRLAAAPALWQHGRGEQATAAMIGEWDHPRPPSRAGRPLKMGQTTTDADMAAENAYENAKYQEQQARGQLIGFLAGCGRVDAIEALGRGLRARPVGTRLDVVSAMAAGPVNGSVSASGRGGSGSVSAERGLRRKGADDDAKVAAAVEALLVAELDDQEQRLGMSGTRNGKSFADPSVCDFAGEVLAERFKERYTFDLGASARERARQRIVCANLWRGEHGQPPLPSPESRRVEPAPEATILPLLRTLAASDRSDEYAAAGASVTKLGLSALAPLRAFKTALPADDPARARLDTLERSLACTVTETTLEFPPSIDEERRRLIRAWIDPIKGQSLTAAAFVELAAGAAGEWSQGADGFVLTAARDEDLGGVRLGLKFVAAGPDGEETSSNHMNEHITLGSDSLLSSSGSGGLDSMRSVKDYKDYVRAAERVFGAAADQPFSLSISVRSR